jgi:hypothetical protein
MRVSGVHARVVLGVYILAILGFAISALLQFDNAYAVQITPRSLTLEGNSTALTAKKPTGSAPSIAGHADDTGKANHHFKFTITTTSAIRAIGFQYCTTATGTCTAPTDLTANGATLGTTVGLAGSPTYNAAVSAPYVSFTADPSATAIEVTLNAVYNPSVTNATFYTRIFTYTSSTPTVGTTAATDSGVVAASTATAIVLTGTMPEYIQFCTGDIVTVNCGSTGQGSITFSKEFSPSDTATATSQMAASTNANTGYVITVVGTTLTSGSNTIPQVGSTATAVAGARGSSKFGLNLVANTTTASNPAVGTAITPASNAGSLRAKAQTNFDTADSFALDLNTTTAIAKSNDGGGGPFPTDSQVYTVSYFVDVSGSQAPGTYVSTLNYVCTATF